MSRGTLVLVNDLSVIGGGQTVMLQLAGAASTAGFEVVLAWPEGPMVQVAEQQGFRSEVFHFQDRRLLTPRLRLPRPGAAFERRSESARLLRLLRAVDARIVHTVATIPHISGLMAARRARLPIIWHLNQVHRRELFAAFLPDRMVAVSRAAFAPATWRRAARRRTTVIGNAVDLERFTPPTPEQRMFARRQLGLGEDRAVVSCIARLEPSKGVDAVIRAVARMRQRATLVVAGDAAGYSGGEAYAAGLPKLADQVGVDLRLLGRVEDARPLLWASDAFAFAPRWEAFGLVLAEAAACGLPVVAPRVGGCGEVVEDGVSGRLVEPGDLDGFARHLDKLVDGGIAAGMAASARRVAEARFDPRRLERQLAALYDGLVPP